MCFKIKINAFINLKIHNLRQYCENFSWIKVQVASCFFGSIVIILFFGIDVLCSSAVNFAMLFEITEVAQYMHS